MHRSLFILSVCLLFAFSTGADAKRCAKGKGYRYINGQKVCPEEMAQPQSSSTQPRLLVNGVPATPVGGGNYIDNTTGRFLQGAAGGVIDTSTGEFLPTH